MSSEPTMITLSLVALAGVGMPKCHSLDLKPTRLPAKSLQGMVRSLTQQQKDEVKEHDGCQKDWAQGLEA